MDSLVMFELFSEYHFVLICCDLSRIGLQYSQTLSLLIVRMCSVSFLLSASLEIAIQHL